MSLRGILDRQQLIYWNVKVLENYFARPFLEVPLPYTVASTLLLHVAYSCGLLWKKTNQPQQNQNNQPSLPSILFPPSSES